MLSNDILTALKGYTANMQKSVTLVLQTGEHSKRNELLEFLNGVASTSEKISVEERDTSNDLGGELRSSISFLLEVEGASTGIQFSGIPSGHEFNSLILSILQSTGTPLKLDETIQTLVGNLKEKLHFEVFISLSCHNCPEVVQGLNQFALLNDNITTEMIDGGLFQNIINERDIQGVPSVYLNGELFANGKVDTATLVSKITELYPEAANVAPAEAMPLQDVVVIGAGLRAFASAIYSARKGLNVTIVADRFGGQVKDTMGIENLISVSKTTGPELTGAMLQHLNDYEVTMKEHMSVTSVEQGDIKKVVLSSGEVIETKTIIVATGARWRELGVPGEKRTLAMAWHIARIAMALSSKGKDVAVIGGGNSGIEAALDLAGIVNSVTVFEFLPELKADQVLVDQAKLRDNITIHKNVMTKQIIATDGKVSAIEYQNRETEEVIQQDLHGVFVQIGLVPNSAFLKDVVELSQYGEVIINEQCQTSEPGIFAAGDVSTVPYKQIVISMGEGAKASLSAFEYLLKLPSMVSEEAKAA